MNPSVSVIIPTTGAITLEKCVRSVLEQTYKNVEPLVVIDGPDFREYACDILWEVEDYTGAHNAIPYCILPQNVGKDGWYGHRIFAAFSYLVNTDYVCFLDQDNWFAPNHIEYLIDTLDANDPNSWAYSLRTIFNKEGNFICRDDCESLGQYGNHIDTSCYLVPTRVLTAGIAAAWYGQWGADRQFYHHLRTNFPNYNCSGTYSLNYRLGGNEGSVTPEFFLAGNKYMADKYNNKFPWNT